jgi:hypothetical protein
MQCMLSYEGMVVSRKIRFVTKSEHMAGAARTWKPAARGCSLRLTRTYLLLRVALTECSARTRNGRGIFNALGPTGCPAEFI